MVYWTLIVAVLSSLLPIAYASRLGTIVFILLHTNDFHNHLTSMQADGLRRLRQAVGKQGLLLDAGDAVASGNVTFKPWGEAILKTMNEIGYDAMTVGNREFHVSRTGFHCKVGLAQFPILCANVRPSGQAEAIHDLNFDSAESGGDTAQTSANARQTQEKQQTDPPVCSHIVRTLQATDGTTLRIVVFGLTVPMVTERMSARHLSAYLFENPIVTAKRLVPQLQAEYQPDVMIALTHIGYPQDRKLAEAVPGIDLIIGGHSHTRLENGERVGDTLIAQTGCFGHHVGYIAISRNNIMASLPDTGNAKPQLSASLLPLPKSLSESEIEAHIQHLRQLLNS